jgi:hypothetical protein
VNSAISPPKHINEEDLDATELSPYVALLQLKVKGLQAVFVDREGPGPTTNPLLGEMPSIPHDQSEDAQLRAEDTSNPKALMKRMSSPTLEEQKDTRSTRHSAEQPSTAAAAAATGAGAKKKPQRRASMFPIAPPVPPPPPSAAEVMVVFPLPAKDPLIEYRKMYNFIKAFQVGDDSSLKSLPPSPSLPSFLIGCRILKHRNAKLKEELLKGRKSYPWRQVTGHHQIEVR